MASGLAVISTSVGNIPDILENNYQALIPKNDTLALKNAIIKMIEDHNYRKQISKNG